MLFKDVLLRTRRVLMLFKDVSLRTKRAFILFKDVPLRNRRVLSLYNIHSDSALLVLNRTLFNSIYALLALSQRYRKYINPLFDKMFENYLMKGIISIGCEYEIIFKTQGNYMVL